MPALSNHCFTRARLPMPAACARSSGTGQIRVSNGSRCVFAYVNAHSIALRRRRRLAPQDCRIEVEQGADEFPAVRLKACGFDEFGLKRHAGIAQQPRLTLQLIDERRQVALIKRALDLRHDKHLPRSERRDLRKVGSSDRLKHLMKDSRSVLRSMCLPSSGSSAMDRSSRSDATASRSKRQADTNASLTVSRSFPFSVESRANGVEIAERRKELQRARQQAFPLKQLEQPLARDWRMSRTPMAPRLRRRRSAAPRTPRA